MHDKNIAMETISGTTLINRLLIFISDMRRYSYTTFLSKVQLHIIHKLDRLFSTNKIL